MARIDDIIEAEDARRVQALRDGQRAAAADAGEKREYAQWIKHQLIASGDLRQTPDPPRKPRPPIGERKPRGRRPPPARPPVARPARRR